jgi:hypothetical protein
VPDRHRRGERPSRPLLSDDETGRASAPPLDYDGAVSSPRLRALAALLSALLGGGCAGAPAAPRPAPGPAQPGAAVLAYQVLEVRDAALNARDLDTAAAAYAPDAVVIDADQAVIVLRGRAAIREAHARFLDRSYGEQGRIVTDVERVRCDWTDPVQGWVRYELSGGAILRVLKHRSPPFGG